MIRALPVLVLAFGLPGVALAQSLDLPSNAELTFEDSTPLASYALPLEPFAEGGLPALTLEGAVTRQAWRIEGAGLSTLQILAPLREQVLAQGFQPMLDCDTEACGGFDFRFATPVLPAPEMFVDLGDFRFVSALRETEAGQEAVSLLVSRSVGAGFVQLIRVAPEGSAAQQTAPVAPAARTVTPAQQGSFAQGLEVEGFVVLSDLTFETGSSQLGPGPYQSLMALAAYLIANPDRTVALVGHTDAEGSLEGNIALSRRRAASVLERLVSVYDVPRRQMEAQGMGYLAPVASNLTPEGRDANRRVEVIITSTQDAR